MKLPDLKDFDLSGKKILLRVNYDVPLSQEGENWKVGDDSRITESLKTINYLLSQNAKVILLSHLGRPEGEVMPEFSLKPTAERLQELLPGISLQFSVNSEQLDVAKTKVTLLENLRFDPGEEANDLEFAQKLASLGNFYINDAFAVSHRAHASVVSLPNLLPHAAGFDLLEEVETLSRILEQPKRPVVVILGGAKADKLDAIPGLLKWVDRILIGGKLPMEIANSKWQMANSEKIIIAELDGSEMDITRESAERFAPEIRNAGTVIWAGPMGKYEERETERGTLIIAKTIADSHAFKAVGGGDTEAALTKYSLVEKIDYISSGGGAMLEFLANGDLPGLKALRE